MPHEYTCKEHTPSPEGYMQWQYWAEEMSKTHAQIRCPTCGLWKIWLPIAEATAINLQDRKLERELVKEINRQEREIQRFANKVRQGKGGTT